MYLEVENAFTTRIAVSETEARIRPSETFDRGGESRITRSKSFLRDFNTSLNRGDSISSPGLGRTGPLGSRNRFLMFVSETASSREQCPSNTLDSPFAFAHLKILCMRGLRISASMRITRAPVCATMTAVLTAVTVLPSPGTALVMTTERVGADPDDKKNDVRTERYDSAMMELGSS